MEVEKTPIPVIGTLIVNGVHWLKRLIASIDYPVEEFVIFNNNGRDQITEELDQLAKEPHAFIKKIKVCHLPHNIGCPGGWNLIIRSYLMSPYWIIVNHDVELGSGFLEAMLQKADDPEVGVVNGEGGRIGIGLWDVFLIKDWVIRDYGLFDESLYPAYADDVDYYLRLYNAKVKTIPSVGVPYKHGDKTYEEGTGSQTKIEEPELEGMIHYARYINEWEYITEKWGPNWRSCDTYSNPYNMQGVPLSYFRFDLEFMRRKYLGF